jgi:hypothetical protein
VAGLEPRGFTWVINGKLAVSERIGGYGIQHRRVRREEEILWLVDAGINSVVSLLAGNQNEAAYELAGLAYAHYVVDEEFDVEDAPAIFEVLADALQPTNAVVLLHRDLVDDTVVGLLGGYLVYAGLVEDPIVATSVIQEIIGRAMGPEGRRLIPQKA